MKIMVFRLNRDVCGINGEYQFKTYLEDLSELGVWHRVFKSKVFKMGIVLMLK